MSRQDAEQIAAEPPRAPVLELPPERMQAAPEADSPDGQSVAMAAVKAWSVQEVLPVEPKPVVRPAADFPDGQSVSTPAEPASILTAVIPAALLDEILLRE